MARRGGSPYIGRNGGRDLLKVLVVIALLGTVAVLLTGVVAMVRGGEFNRKYGNKLMRARIAMQALAVGLMFSLYLINQAGGE